MSDLPSSIQSLLDEAAELLSGWRKDKSPYSGGRTLKVARLKLKRLDQMTARLQEIKSETQNWQKTNPSHQVSFLGNPLHLLLSERMTFEEVRRNQHNVIAALSNGGNTESLTDKNGNKYIGIADFRPIGSQDFVFDEQTILDDPRPSYVPALDSDALERRAFAMDAIEIEENTFLVAQSRYADTKLNPDHQNYYVLLTLDQLVLTNDYYITRQKALNRQEADKRNERILAQWDSLPKERKETIMKKVSYEMLNSRQKKKVSRSEWDSFSPLQRANRIPWVKHYHPKRIKYGNSFWHDKEGATMSGSYHQMYENFVNPKAEVRIKGYKRIAHPEVWQSWQHLTQALQWKLTDIREQRKDFSESRKVGMETAYGQSNSISIEEYGVKVKRQNGEPITTLYIEDFRHALESCKSVFPGILRLLKDQNPVLSHSAKTYMYASKAIGVFIPELNAIGVSKKFGTDQFHDTLAHELAHFIDHHTGKRENLRFASDKRGSLAEKIGYTFRAGLNEAQSSSYLNATKECFARAMQQHFAIATRGNQAKGASDIPLAEEGKEYIHSGTFVSLNYYENKIKPLIKQFLSETLGKSVKDAPKAVTPNEESPEGALQLAEAEALALAVELELLKL